MKKVANKKQRDTAAEDEEMKARKLAQAEKANAGPDEDGPGDLLADEDDQDVIF